MNMATLYQIDEDGSREERCEIGDGPVVVGRNGRAHVSVDDDGISRRHFAIVRDGEDYIIKDLNSRNGTWVDGRRVIAEKLRHNDRILAGRTQFVFTDPPVAVGGTAQALTGPHGTQIIQPDCRLQDSFHAAGGWEDAFAGPAPGSAPADSTGARDAEPIHRGAVR
jgi:predicted component of type VI protein secretion system